ncbi:SGNH/GDSL hydrolase family protein [Streptomyces sp. NPDC002734]|uniref:SGNH/GDSL hydrolase family protein n=1 Tax=Streptomyces sp. NPDC002734 TaxID=3154426 RepID=UPI003321DC8F
MLKAVRVIVALLLVLLGTAPVHAVTPDRRAAKEKWTGTWAAAASGTAVPLPGASIRNVVHTSVGGTATRVRLSNRLGVRPLHLGSVTVALQEQGYFPRPDAVPGTMRRVLFGGRPTAVVPAGREIVSDPVRLDVPGGSDLLVTVYTPLDDGPATYHRIAKQTNFLAHGADHAADVGGAAYTSTVRSWYYVTGVDVRTARAAGSLVALGDSLTDGVGTTPDSNSRWPDRLADRIAALPPRHRLGVLNAGISGNRILNDRSGPGALKRFDADVLRRSGVRTVIVLEGINDVMTDAAGEDGIKAFKKAYRSMAKKAHAKGIRVVGATLTPYRGHFAYTPQREALRRQINRFIRKEAPFDAVVDFDAAVRDPKQPDRIRSAFDPGDHLHFNDAGMKALARAVDLDQLTG